MLRNALLLIHLIELLIWSWLYVALGEGGFFTWLMTVLCAGLALRALIILLTFVIARTPWRPWSLALSVFAAEFYAAVRLYSWDSIIGAPAFSAPAPASGDPQSAHLPVLFIHGFTCNAGFWRKHLAYFQRHGSAHLATISLEPIHNRIDAYAPQISTAVEELLARSGSDQCIIVGHSMGGLATRYFLSTEEAQRVKGVVTLGTPHSGTMMAHFSFAKNAHQMRRLSQWLERLGAQEKNLNLPPFSALVGTHDNIVSPQECAAYEPASNTYMTGISHIAMAYDMQVINWTFKEVLSLSQ